MSFGLIGPAVTALLLAGCGDEGPATETETDAGPSTPVRTVAATLSERRDTVRTAGRVVSKAEMDLSFRVSGYVAELLVDEGARVQQGEVLARLRTEEVDAAVRSAEAQARVASLNLSRMERLHADSVITGAALEEAERAHEQAQAALESARFKQTYATIRAPYAGNVLRRTVEVSEFVAAGTPVLRMAATGSGWIVSAQVADRHLPGIALGDPAEILLPALGSVPLSGHVGQIADAADPRTGTFEIEIVLDGSSAALRSGMIARVRIVPSAPEPMVVLPTVSLVDTDGREAAVFVVDDDRAQRRPVRVLRIWDDAVGVDASLEGARVVSAGAAYLRDGERVEDR